MTSDSSSAAPSVERLRQRLRERRKGGCQYAPCHEYVPKQPEDYGYGSCKRCGWAEPEHIIDELVRVLDHERSLVAEIQRQGDEIEVLRMQLAACMAAALGNTPATVAERLPREHPYWSAAYHDVCNAVDREMTHRQRLEAAEAEIQRLTDALKTYGQHKFDCEIERGTEMEREQRMWNRIKGRCEWCGNERHDSSNGACQLTRLCTCEFTDALTAQKPEQP